MRYLPPLPLSAPSGPASSSAACQTSSMFAASEPPSGGRHLNHHRPDILRVEEGHEVDRVRIGRQCLVFPIERARPVDELIDLTFGLSEHLLKHEIVVDRRHSPDNGLNCAPLDGAPAPIASGENADRKREIAFTRDPFMFFGDTLDAVARVARISVRGRNKMTNFIWTRG
jgi:hypothetical protein